MTDETEHGAREVLERIVRTATYSAHSKGPSSMEVAASMVSYLAAHLDLVPGFMRGMESPNGWPSDWRSGGDLTWRGPDGLLHDPGEDTPEDRASGTLLETAVIVSWLRGQAGEHRRQSDNADNGLASRLEHERGASLIEEIADGVERGTYLRPLGRSMA